MFQATEMQTCVSRLLMPAVIAVAYCYVGTMTGQSHSSRWMHEGDALFLVGHLLLVFGTSII